MFLLLLALGGGLPAVSAQTPFGAQGAEGQPNRRQPWLVPSPDPDVAAHALLFRPPGAGPFPLALIAHRSASDPARRAQMPQPEYAALAAWLVGRGYAVLVPQRPGHGSTGGPYLEDPGGCDDADYSRSGYAAADSIKAALDYLRDQPFVNQAVSLVIGDGEGGWGALALADEDPKIISAIVAFAPGRGGHAHDGPDRICAPDALTQSASEFGEDAHVPVIWLVAANDTYFPPDFSRQMVNSFGEGGDKVDFRILPAFGNEGHALAEAGGGDRLFGPVLDETLRPGPAGGNR